MITIDHGPQRISVAIFGKFTLADYQEFEELFDYKSRFEGPQGILLDLRNMAGFTLDVALEDFKLTREHREVPHRIAVLTESQWITWSALLNQFFVEASVMVFNDEAEALAWLDASSEETTEE
ncbi:MAG TPA: STAS/SEC14 domain-containing protein [Azoarcus sp.]|nr:STAS/SEC14 domain-containing protein [Azoarcus sp.]